MAERTGGAFWQPCKNCGSRAQASLTPKGKRVLCRDCIHDLGVTGYLDQPTKAEKKAFVAVKAPKKAPKPRQVAKAKATARSKAKAGGSKRPAKKVA